MQEVSVIIPNWNGMKYLKNCLDSLRIQSVSNFDIIMVDNGSEDGSVDFVKEHYPEVLVHRLKRNTGFCHAVNVGIRMSTAPYVLLLNNDTVCDRKFVEELVKGIKQDDQRFSCSAKMLQLQQPEQMDDGGDYYCALGWAFAVGKGKPETEYDRPKKIFAACGGAAIYRRDLLEQTGLFDERHFAYLEDIDVAYRAKIRGYENWYLPKAVVYHAGSAASGSRYNEFKVRCSSRNSIYLIYKNMPFLQMILNLPFLMIGFLIKAVFFAKKGLGMTYLRGLAAGVQMCRRSDRVRYERKNLKNYVRIQLELWVNVVRRIL